jgi:acetyl-CoA/propionyl-CoA carboxylase biotin carboxyl carrier protein
MVRALEETSIAGIATTIPAHLAVLKHPDFLAARHSTNWLEARLELPAAPASPRPEAVVSRPAPRQSAAAAPARAVSPSAAPWRSRDGVPSVTTWRAGPGSAGLGSAPGSSGRSADRAGTVVAPLQGTVIRLLASVGATVTADTGVCVVEAMKMENLVRAGTSGTVTQVLVAAGDQIEPGAVIATVDQAD